MRTVWNGTALSFVILLAACGKRQEPVALSADLQKDLATVSSGSDLAIAPKSYQPMRFVSAIEQSRPIAPAKRPSTSHERMHAVSHHVTQPMTDVASEPTVTAVAGAATTVSTPEAAAPAPSITVAPAPAPEPSSAPAGSSSGGTVGDHDQGGGLAGLLGGIMGAVIRGGHVGVDKCDPRTDGRRGGVIIGPPVFENPAPTGQPVFSGMPRRR
jgi:hypothetical protein